jgi:hypothetical protein
VNTQLRGSVPGTDVLSDPNWFLSELNGEAGIFRFVRTDHETLASQPFLDRRWKRDGLAVFDVPVDELLRSVPSPLPPTPLQFLWHTGFCCSTLIARLLDKPGRNLSLCEPNVLTTLADARRSGALPDWNTTMRACQVVFHLLGRPMEPGAAVTIKPTPSSCCFLGEAVQLTNGRMVFLYSNCTSFVISVIKLGEEGRDYVARMLQALTLDGLRPPGTANLSELEAAALLWHMQLAAFRKHVAALGLRAASLDCDTFLASPREALTNLDDFFELGLGRNHIAEVLEGPLFRRNSKNAEEEFDPRRRREEHEAAKRTFGSAVGDAVARARMIFAGPPLPNPLMPVEKVL